MKVPLVHDYLTKKGGEEGVFELLDKRLPSADMFTSLYDVQNIIDLGECLVYTNGIQNILDRCTESKCKEK